MEFVLFALGVGLTLSGIYRYSGAIRRKNWAKTQAVIESFRLVEIEQSQIYVYVSYEIPALVYSYSFRGVSYRGSRIIASSEPRNIADWLRSSPKLILNEGAELLVWVNPQDPSTSLIFPGMTVREKQTAGVLCTIGACCIVIAVLMI